MMKKYIFMILAVLTVCACQDFLVKENPNRIESDFYFTDESSLEIYTNGMIRSAASSIKGFIDGDKNADTHSWDGHGQLVPAQEYQLLSGKHEKSRSR